MELPYIFTFGMVFPGHEVALFIYVWDELPRACSCLIYLHLGWSS